mgnify:CR=1 FL=1
MQQLLLIGIALAMLAALAIFGFLFFAWSAKKTLVRGETAWSAKKIPIKRKRFDSKKKRSDSFLESISAETSEYLKSKDESNNK